MAQPQHQFPEGCFHEVNEALPADPFLVWAMEQIDGRTGAVTQLPDRSGELVMNVSCCARRSRLNRCGARSSFDEERKTAILKWLETRPDIVEARQGKAYRRGTTSTASSQRFSPKTYTLPQTVLDLLFIYDEDSHDFLLKLHDNVEYELNESALEGEERSATLWRLGCTGVLHHLHVERKYMRKLRQDGLSPHTQQVRQSGT
jgi:hypothetical protein